MAEALELYDVTKSYQDGEASQVILNKISLKVKKGEFVAIIGPSGSGKSTLLSIIGALLSADEGTIKIDDVTISEMSQKEWTKVRSKKIGFIFQNHQLLPYLTTRDQLRLVYSINKEKRQEHLVEQLLSELGLEECANKYPQSMSGGQKQRVAIARALMNDPSLILADEPTASLDAERGRQVVTMIQKVVKKRQKAAIMVTHDERVLDLVDTVYRLEGGRLVQVN